MRTLFRNCYFSQIERGLAEPTSARRCFHRCEATTEGRPARRKATMTRRLLRITLVATIAALHVGQAMAAHSFHRPASRMPPASQAAPPTATPAFGPAPAQGYYQPPMTIP